MHWLLVLIFNCCILPGQTATLKNNGPRTSSVLATQDFGNNDFFSLNIDVGLGLNEKVLLLGGVGLVRHSPGQRSNEQRFGVDYKLREGLSAKAILTRTAGPVGILSWLITTALSWNVSELWEAERTTTIDVSVEGARLTRSTTENSPLSTERIYQFPIGLGIAQEINEQLLVSLNYTKYFYTSGQVLKYLDQSRVFFPQTASRLDAFPDSAFGFRLLWEFFETWVFSGQAILTKTKIQQSFPTFEAILTHLPTVHWSAGIRSSLTHLGEGHTDYTIGVELGYSW